MGRVGWKTTAESTHRIDLARLKTLGLIPKEGTEYGTLDGLSVTGQIWLQVSTTGPEPFMRLIYRTTDWRERDYWFNLEKLPCRYGGFKWFVRCGLHKNGNYCGRRARVLYSTGDWYGCRNCSAITYESCNQSGRSKGLVSLSKLQQVESNLARRLYAGKPTRKYRRYLKLNRQFAEGCSRSLAWLEYYAKRHQK